MLQGKRRGDPVVLAEVESQHEGTTIERRLQPEHGKRQRRLGPDSAAEAAAALRHMLVFQQFLRDNLATPRYACTLAYLSI